MSSYSRTEVANAALIRELERWGMQVNLVIDTNYFYCDIISADGETEVCGDSRANVRPRTPLEAVCVAAITMPDEEQNWDRLLLALDIDKSKLRY